MLYETELIAVLASSDEKVRTQRRLEQEAKDRQKRSQKQETLASDDEEPLKVIDATRIRIKSSRQHKPKNDEPSNALLEQVEDVDDEEFEGLASLAKKRRAKKTKREEEPGTTPQDIVMDERDRMLQEISASIALKDEDEGCATPVERDEREDALFALERLAKTGAFSQAEITRMKAALHDTEQSKIEAKSASTPGSTINLIEVSSKAQGKPPRSGRQDVHDEMAADQADGAKSDPPNDANWVDYFVTTESDFATPRKSSLKRTHSTASDRSSGSSRRRRVRWHDEADVRGEPVKGEL